MDMEYVLDRPEASAPRTNQVQQSGAGAVQGPPQIHTHSAQHTPPQQQQQQQQQQPQPSRCPYFRGAHQHHAHQQHQQNHFSSLPLPPPHHPQFSHHQIIPHPHQSRLQSQTQIPVVGFLPQSPNHNLPPHSQPVAHYHYHYDPTSNLWYPAIHWSQGLPTHPPIYHHQPTTSSEAYFASSSENQGPRQALFGTGSGSGSGSSVVAGGSGVAGLGLLQSQPPPVLHHHHPNPFPPLVLTRPPLPGDGAFAPVLFTGPPPGALPFPGATPLMPSHQINHANNANNTQSSVNPATSYSAVQQLQQTTIGLTYTANMPTSGEPSSNFTTSRWSVVDDQEGRENENGAPLVDATTSPSPTTFSGGSPPPREPSDRPELDEFIPRPTAQPHPSEQFGRPPLPLWATASMNRSGPRQGSTESDEYMTAPGSDSAQPDESTTSPQAASAEPGESMTAPRSESSDHRQFGQVSSEVWGPAPMTQAPRPQRVLERSDSPDEDEDEVMTAPTTRSDPTQQPAQASLQTSPEQFPRLFARLPQETRGPGTTAQAPRSQSVTITRSDSSDLDEEESNAMPVPATRPDPSGQFGRLGPELWGPMSMNRPDPPELPLPSALPTTRQLQDHPPEQLRQFLPEQWGRIRVAQAPQAPEGRRPTMSRRPVPPADSDYDSDEDLDQLEEDDRALRFIEQFSVSGDFPRDMGEAQVRAHQLLRGQVTNRRVASRRAVSQLLRVDIDSLEESERTCVICYNEYGVKNPEGLIEEPLRLPRCKHLFGENCIKKWFTQSDTCPYCRDKLPSEPIMPSSPQYIREMYRQYPGARGPGPNGHSARTLPMPMPIGDVNIRIVPHLGDDPRVDSSPPRGSQTGERRSPPSEASESRRRTRPRYSGFHRASPSASGSNGNRQSTGGSQIAPPHPQQSPARDRTARQRPYSYHHTGRRPFNMPPYHPAEPLGPRPPTAQQPVRSYMGDDGAMESYQPNQLTHQSHQNQPSQPGHQNRPTFFGTARGPYSNHAGLPVPGSVPGPDQFPNPDAWTQ